MLDLLLWFVEKAQQNRGGIWLAVPSGMLTGFAITPEEYIQASVEQGTFRKSVASPTQTSNEEQVPLEELPTAPIFLQSASLFSGTFTHNLDLAVVDPRQVAAFGWFNNLTRQAES